MGNFSESAFENYSDRVFAHIQAALDDADVDMDSRLSGNVLTLENDAGAQVVVNRHSANQELWIAAPSGGYHFQYRDGQWLGTRDGRDFYSVLSEAVSTLAGETVHISAVSWDAA